MTANLEVLTVTLNPAVDETIFLDRLQGRGWTVVASDAPELDNRMVDSRVSVKPITARLSEDSRG